VTTHQPSQVIKTFNVGLLSCMLILFASGLLTLFSATKGPALGSLTQVQLLHFAIGLTLGLGILFIDSQIFERFAYVFYFLCLVLLVIVVLKGSIGGGAQRWIRVGFFNLQPSELAKLGIVMALARYFAREKHGGPYSLKRLLVPMALVAPLFILILLQPDLGTAGILFLVAATMVLFLRVEWQSLVIVGVLTAITLPLAYQYVLRDYQRERVKTFIEPGRDPRDKGYNALQCRIAVGSGRIFGKGYLKGTQAQLNFIPEQQTDFIFSVFAEEIGFLGGLFLIATYAAYCIFALRIVARARDKFQMLLAMGCTALLFWHAFINIGMVSGILPIVGVTLPFFSYGGSSLITFVISTALLLNIGRKKYIF